MHFCHNRIRVLQSKLRDKMKNLLGIYYKHEYGYILYSQRKKDANINPSASFAERATQYLGAGEVKGSPVTDRGGRYNSCYILAAGAPYFTDADSHLLCSIMLDAEFFYFQVTTEDKLIGNIINVKRKIFGKTVYIYSKNYKNNCRKIG